MKKLITFLFVLLLLHGCASGQRLVDKSYVVKDTGAKISGSIAILPAKEVPAMAGLADMVENELDKGLRKTFPGVRVVDVDKFKAAMLEKDIENEFGQWKSTYDSTKIISSKPLKSFSNASDSRFFILIPAIYLSREPINIHETGFSGFYQDGQAFWRTDLKILVEVLDTEKEQIIWKGVGYTQHIHSPTRYNAVLVIWDERNPEVQEYVAPMIKTAVDSIVANIAGIKQSAQKH